MVVGTGVAPPVPAALRVEHEAGAGPPDGTGDRLRIEHDRRVRVGPAVVARVAYEGVADALDALATAVKRHVDAAAPDRARPRDVGVPGVGHADRVRVAAGEFALVEFHERPRWRARRRLQAPVDVLQQLAGGVVVTVVDEGRAGDAALVAEVLGHHGVAGRPIVDDRDAPLRHEVAVKALERLDDRPAHRRVLRAAEQPHARTGEVRARVDGAGRGQTLGERPEPGGVGDRRPGARRQTVVGGGPDAALGAIVGPAGEHAGALHKTRVRDVELHRHVAAG